MWVAVNKQLRDVIRKELPLAALFFVFCYIKIRQVSSMKKLNSAEKGESIYVLFYIFLKLIVDRGLTIDFVVICFSCSSKINTQKDFF